MKQILSTYNLAFHFVSKHKLIVLLCYVISLALIFVFTGPLSNFLALALDRSHALEELLLGFDYDVVMDLFNYHEIPLKMSLGSVASGLLLYLLWNTFSAGGFLYLSKMGSQKITDFWKGGALYFFRFLRIAIYQLFIYLFFLVLAYLYFSKDGLNVLEMDSEVFLIKRFYGLCFIFAIMIFFVTIFRDIARVNIIDNDKALIFYSNLNAFRSSFNFKNIALGLLNVLILIAVISLYIGLKSLQDHFALTLLITTQVYLLLRIYFRAVRTVSFHYLNK